MTAAPTPAPPMRTHFLFIQASLPDVLPGPQPHLTPWLAFVTAARCDWTISWRVRRRGMLAAPGLDEYALPARKTEPASLDHEFMPLFAKAQARAAEGSP